MIRIGKLHLLLGLAAGMLILGSHAQGIAQGSLNIGGNTANYGVHAVQANFVPDPVTFNVVSGGNLNARNMNLGPGCVGHVTRNPDVIVNYSGNNPSFLKFFVRASGDTALVINDPRGRWMCNDDSVGTNPVVAINQPATGQYDIWVSSYSAGQNIRATLGVTELQHVGP